MSVAELKRLVDERTPEERRWMEAYLYSLGLTQDDRAELQRRMEDMDVGKNCVSWEEAERRIAAANGR